MTHKKSLAIIGIGHWGKNLLREFNKIADIGYCYHRNDPENYKWLKKNYPDIEIVSSYNEILENPKIDAVIIATPIATHYELAKKALLASKNAFVEKPITDNVRQAQELIKLATKKKRILFVGHIFSYHPVLLKIKQIIRKEPLKYTAFVWNKLGTFNEELIYNLLSHDVATALDLFGSSSTSWDRPKLVLDKPTSIKTLENRGVVTNSDIIYTRLNFPNNLPAQVGRSCTIYINRISNLKNKTITLVTAKNIYLWENNRLLRFDLNKTGFVKIFQSSVTPLEIECQKFIKCLTQRKNPPTDGEFGLKVVKILSKI